METILIAVLVVLIASCTTLMIMIHIAIKRLHNKYDFFWNDLLKASEAWNGRMAIELERIDSIYNDLVALGKKNR